MIAFFTILFILLAINAFLLVFSVNGAKERFKKPIEPISDTSIAKLTPKESSEGEYKKAV
ncbi:hypothetical protein [Flagellimonas allohymeniacidonis]|uniref:Uncharacterized protein n=1 Tax=Flagellimonas allohymeniacidonis TaxID=2517819 RepID=A0A4Q8QG57_9FLAO|nr:hypothetical protein [Allomuricauda hymeniacidonis]TAI49451.1 hypothetical protein EW142_06525 [Allomuricauda hymeniacidonis]